MQGASGSQYGALVMGEAEFVEDQKAHAARNSIYGELLTEGKPAYGKALSHDIPPVMVTPDGPLDEKSLVGVSISALSDILAAQPSLFAAAVDAELDRPEGPRAGALTLLIAHAEATGKSADLITALRSFLPKTPAAEVEVVETPATVETAPVVEAPVESVEGEGEE